MKPCLTRRDFLTTCSASLVAARMAIAHPTSISRGHGVPARGYGLPPPGPNGSLPLDTLPSDRILDPTDRVPAGPEGTVLTVAGQARRDRHYRPRV